MPNAPQAISTGRLVSARPRPAGSHVLLQVVAVHVDLLRGVGGADGQVQRVVLRGRDLVYAADRLAVADGDVLNRSRRGPGVAAPGPDDYKGDDRDDERRSDQ